MTDFDEVISLKLGRLSYLVIEIFASISGETLADETLAGIFIGRNYLSGEIFVTSQKFVTFAR